MTPPPDRLAALIEAHRQVRRPPPGLREQVSRALAAEVEEEVPPAPRSRWLESAAISVAIAAAALLLLHWLAGPQRGRQAAVDDGPSRDQSAFGADDKDASGQAVERAPEPATPRGDLAAPVPETEASAPADAASPQLSILRRPARPPNASRDDGTLEIRMLRDAEVALAKDPHDALRRLKAHASRFPRSALAVERAALWALAACATGATDARARRDGFLAAHPGSAYAARVRAACAR